MEEKREMTCADWFFCTEKLANERMLSTISKK